MLSIAQRDVGGPDKNLRYAFSNNLRTMKPKFSVGDVVCFMRDPARLRLILEVYRTDDPEKPFYVVCQEPNGRLQKAGEVCYDYHPLATYEAFLKAEELV